MECERCGGTGYAVPPYYVEINGRPGMKLESKEPCPDCQGTGKKEPAETG
jgi:DnaJ-class molecular chaperone